MSVLPRTKQIKLPFASRPIRDQPSSICGMFNRCEEKQSKYICPRCNVYYCSLDCFRSENHAQCSEPFYQSSIRDAIAADPEASNDDKREMMEMLKRFEEGQAELEGLANNDVEEEEEEEQVKELKKRLDGIDIDSLDSNALFHLLPSSHQTAFISLLKDPESEQARELLAAPEKNGREQAGPWWDQDADGTDGEADLAGTSSARSRPEAISESTLVSIRIAPDVAEKLIYNMIAIALAYVHLLPPLGISVIQTLPSSSPLRQSLKSHLHEFLPFLSDAKSTVRHASLRAAWSAIWPGLSHVPEGRGSVEILMRHLQTLQALARLPLEIGEPSGLLLLLSDLYDLLGTPKASTAGAKKLLFYVAAMTAVPRDRWLALVAEIGAEVERLEEELDEDDETAVNGEATLKVQNDASVKADGVAKIVELN